MRRPPNPTDRAARQYTVQVSIAMVVYVLLLVGGLTAVHRFDLQGVLRYVVVLLPLLPVIAIAPAVLRYFRDTDEFERQLTSESLAIAAGVTAVYSITCGFLESAGTPRISAWYTWLVVMGTWAIARIVLRWRYR